MGAEPLRPLETRCRWGVKSTAEQGGEREPVFCPHYTWQPWLLGDRRACAEAPKGQVLDDGHPPGELVGPPEEGRMRQVLKSFVRLRGRLFHSCSGLVP